MKRTPLLLFVALLAIPSQAKADPLASWCFDGWMGEICVDVTNFQIQSGMVTVDTDWYGAGYPTGNIDHHGRGPGIIIGFLHLTAPLVSQVPNDPTATTRTTQLQWTGLEDEFGNPINTNITGIGDISEFGIIARRSPDFNQKGWDEAGCTMAGYSPRLPTRAQTCRRVPEPAPWMLVLGGVAGLVALRQNRERHVAGDRAARI